MDYIKVNVAHTVIHDIQDTSGGETISYQVIKGSDGSEFASGNMAHLTGILWKLSFTPDTVNETYIVLISYAAKDWKWKYDFKCTGLDVTTPVAGDTYCVASDVSSVLEGMSFSDTTNITTSELEAVIVERTALINSRLGDKYTTPLTGAESLKILKIVCKYGVAADVLDILATGTRGGGGKSRSPQAVYWAQLFDKLLDDIMSEKLPLTSTDRSCASDVTRTGKYDSAGDEREPVFKMEDEF